MIPFSLLWLGFALFWEWSVLGSNAPLLFRLWGIPFICIGLYNAFGRFWVAAREAERTFYAVTNQRILVQSGAFSRTFSSLSLAGLSALHLTEQTSGIGPITFTAPGPFQAWLGGVTQAGNRQQPLALWCIPRASEVYRIIEEARRRGGTETQPLGSAWA